MDRRAFLTGVSPILLAHPFGRLVGSVGDGRTQERHPEPVPSDAPHPPVRWNQSPAGEAFRVLLWDGDYVHSRPCYDGAGKRILYMRAPAGRDPAATAGADTSPWSLWSVSTTGREPELLFEHPEIRATRPDSCRLTGKIAFTGIRNGGGELWIVNGDGTGSTHIPIGDPPRTRVFYPSWYSDGERVAVTDYEARQVLSVSISSGEVVALSDPQQVWAGMCAVSPQAHLGGPVAFAGQAPGASYSVASNTIWLTRAGAPAEPLDGEQGRTPAWSPIGTSLAFSSTRPRPAPAIMMRKRSLPGGRSSVFVASPAPEPEGAWKAAAVSPVDHTAIHPKWSPEGTELVLMVRSLVDGRSGIAVLTA